MFFTYKQIVTIVVAGLLLVMQTVLPVSAQSNVVEIEVSDFSRAPNYYAAVPVYVSDITSLMADRLEFSITYDAESLRFLGLVTNDRTLLWWAQFGSFTESKGRVDAYFNFEYPIYGKGMLVILEFEVLAESGAKTVIGMEDISFSKEGAEIQTKVEVDTSEFLVLPNARYNRELNSIEVISHKRFSSFEMETDYLRSIVFAESESGWIFENKDGVIHGYIPNGEATSVEVPVGDEMPKIYSITFDGENKVQISERQYLLHLPQLSTD